MTTKSPEPGQTPGGGPPSQEQKASPGLPLLSAFALVFLCLGLVFFFAPEESTPAPTPTPGTPEPPTEPLEPANSPEKIQALLNKAPKPLQLHFVRQLENHSAEAKRPVLTAFLGRSEAIHPGALLESVLQVKRCGEPGARDLIQLYEDAPGKQRHVILQAFESSPDPADSKILKDLVLSPQDPLAARWASLKRG